MKNYIKLLSLLLLLIMLVQSTVFSAFAINPITVEATDVYQTATGYTDSDDVKYRKSGSYIYNWGAREEVATFLSPNAISFYTGSYTYDVISEISGGTSQSNAPSSALYKALQSLMKSKQTYETSYQATRPLYQYTDCQLNGYHPQYSNKISSFYSGDPIGPEWDSGSTWNREHTWPNSKGDASGNGENDIMMLRPTATSENGSRGNKAYGEGSSFYYPNSESNGAHDVRGDVARICLYVYVRWGNTTSMWGSSGVIESLDILLEWMEEDPVDTWEMGRNDSVQSITGTRNVFVDYPEYAWLLFGEEIPADMVTPSGEASEDKCEHNWSITSSTNATCTAAGSTVYECTKCSETKTEATQKLGHSLGDWVVDKNATETETGTKHRDCSRCDYTETATIPLIGHTHTYSSVVTAPTCSKKGYTTHTCACGNYYVDSYTDTVPHTYIGGACIVCGAKDPNAPAYTADDFSNIVTALVSGQYIGEGKYKKICEAINIYNTLSSDDKNSISTKYDILVSIANQYNDEIKTVNSDSSVLGSFDAVTVNTSLLFAAYVMLNKKYY